jgi:DNA-binding MarR family transcriptional regulator
MVKPVDGADISQSDYQALAEFRYQIRRFLYFSETAAHGEGLEPQQHQMILAIRASGEPEGPTIGTLADYLFIRHHSAVGLIDRLVNRGLVVRTPGTKDRREVRVNLTREGDDVLSRLSAQHRAELRESIPALITVLTSLLENDVQTYPISE